MALNSTPRRRFGVALGVVLTGVTAGFVGFAGTAAAHTPNIKAVCENGVTTLTVNLVKYNTEKANTVKVTDGDKVLDETEFGEKYNNKWEVGGDVDHTFTIDVHAWDDASGKQGWTFTKVKEVAKCVETTTTTETTTETTTSPTETTTTAPPTETTTTEAPTSSTVVPTTPVPTTTPAPEVEEAALAETGASIALPLGIAGVLLVGGGVALFIVRKRGKA